MTLISLTDTYTRPMNKNQIEKSNNNTTDIQRQALDKRRQMAEILKGKLDRKKSPTPHG